jgi:hypothetical protein
MERKSGAETTRLIAVCEFVTDTPNGQQVSASVGVLSREHDACVGRQEMQQSKFPIRKLSDVASINAVRRRLLPTRI